MKSWIKIGVPVILAFLIAGCRMSINGGLSVDDGDKVNRDLLSINGTIRVGTGCQVRGWCRSINGSVDIGDESRITGAQSINGQVSLGRDVWVRSGLMSINGSIQCEPGCMVGKDIRTINGFVQLDSSDVKGEISTHNGDIRLYNGSVVHGDLVIKKSQNNKHERDREHRTIQIDIDGRSIVKGNVVNRDPDVKVEVRLSNGGKLLGKVEGAKLIESEKSAQDKDF